MKNFTIAALTILGLSTHASAADLTVDHPEMQQLWSQWKDTHSKSYSSAEEARRMNIFAENYNKIVAHNAEGNTVVLAINKFSDLTSDEWKAQYAGGFVPKDVSEGETQEPDNEDKRFLGSTSSLPASFDWRSKGAIGPVKNQKQCKGCWAFAAAGSLEALHQIKTGSLLSFSEQQLLDCDKTSHGCNAGHMSTALTYTAQNGIELETEYPFKDATQSCKYKSGQAYHVNKGYTSVKSNNPEALKSALLKQPVMVAIEANQSVFQHYKSGVITSGCGATPDHAVLAVGYTTVNGHEAFIVKNSYGANWGESGYVYISTSSSANGGQGVCGILGHPAYPTV